MDIRTCVKLAYKQVFMSIFTSEESPMLLVWPQAIQEDAPEPPHPTINRGGGIVATRIYAKLAYKQVLMPIFTSEESPMLLVWPQAIQEDAPEPPHPHNK